MKILPTALVARGSGSIGGVAFRWRNGVMVAQPRRGPTGQRTERRQRRREYLGVVGGRWRDLTSAQREQWEDVAVQVNLARGNKNGNGLTGWGAYVEQSLALFEFGLESAPSVPAYPVDYAVQGQYFMRQGGLWYCGTEGLLESTSGIQLVTYERCPGVSTRSRRKVKVRNLIAPLGGIVNGASMAARHELTEQGLSSEFVGTGSTDWSVGMWFEFEDVGTVQLAYVRSPDLFFGIVKVAGQWFLGFADGPVQIWFGTPISPGFHQIFLSYSLAGGGANGYLDGVSVGPMMPVTGLNPEGAIRIGGLTIDSFDGGVAGWIHGAMVEERAWTAAEVAANYNGGAGGDWSNSINPLAAWSMRTRDGLWFGENAAQQRPLLAATARTMKPGAWAVQLLGAIDAPDGVGVWEVGAIQTALGYFSAARRVYQVQ